MPEYYNLPVLYTPEERERYMKWGIKKEKLTKPLVFLVIVIDVLVALSTICFGVMLVMGRDPYQYLMLSLFSSFATSGARVAALFLTLLIVRPLDLLYDFIFRKPPDPMMLRLAPSVGGVLYELQREGKTLRSGLITWQQWKTVVYHQLNEIMIEDLRLKIGQNTLQTIYPPHWRHSWMDHPAEKIVGTINLGKIQKNMEGYLASLEEQKRESEWISQNG